jgi:hypothetical protein
MSGRDIYIAIMVAAAKGHGVRLTYDECFSLSLDDAINTRAHNGLDETDWPQHADLSAPSIDWAKIDPHKKRIGMNLATG